MFSMDGRVRTESGAGTLVGENMYLREDPFNVRSNLFKSQSSVVTRKNNRNSVPLDAFGDRNNFMQLDDDLSMKDSVISANFGGIKPIRTPGFS